MCFVAYPTYVARVDASSSWVSSHASIVVVSEALVFMCRCSATSTWKLRSIRLASASSVLEPRR